MKTAYLSLILSFITLSSTFTSCSESQKKTKSDKPKFKNTLNANLLVRQWKLNTLERKNFNSNQNNDSKIGLKNQPTDVILSLMENGYFVIYDTFIDPRFNQNGLNRISERSKGQWEFLKNKNLVLKHNTDDSARIETLEITFLNENTLVTKSEDKKATIYRTYIGY